MNGRRGMALLAILWVIVALTALAAAATQQARAGSAATADRVAAVRGRWAAEGCLAVSQSRIEQRLARQAPLTAAFDTVTYGNGVACLVEALDPGSRIHRDSADPATLALLDTILAASDSPEVDRESHLTSHGDGRISLMSADAHVLATLPGFSDEAIRITLQARQWARPLTSLDDLIARLTPEGRRAVIPHYPSLAARITVRETAILLNATAWTGSERYTARIEVLGVPSGSRLAITERRLR